MMQVLVFVCLLVDAGSVYMYNSASFTHIV